MSKQVLVPFAWWILAHLSPCDQAWVIPGLSVFVLQLLRVIASEPMGCSNDKHPQCAAGRRPECHAKEDKPSISILSEGRSHQAWEVTFSPCQAQLSWSCTCYILSVYENVITFLWMEEVVVIIFPRLLPSCPFLSLIMLVCFTSVIFRLLSIVYWT